MVNLRSERSMGHMFPEVSWKFEVFVSAELVDRVCFCRNCYVITG